MTGVVDGKLLRNEGAIGGIVGGSGAFQLDLKPCAGRRFPIENLDVAVDAVVLLHVVDNSAKQLQDISKQPLASAVDFVLFRFGNHHSSIPTPEHIIAHLCRIVQGGATAIPQPVQG